MHTIHLFLLQLIISSCCVEHTGRAHKAPIWCHQHLECKHPCTILHPRHAKSTRFYGNFNAVLALSSSTSSQRALTAREPSRSILSFAVHGNPGPTDTHTLAEPSSHSPHAADQKLNVMIYENMIYK